jgi:hypothetical protein
MLSTPTSVTCAFDASCTPTIGGTRSGHGGNEAAHGKRDAVRRPRRRSAHPSDCVDILRIQVFGARVIAIVVKKPPLFTNKLHRH